jgi:hypothetical protein
MFNDNDTMDPEVVSEGEVSESPELEQLVEAIEESLEGDGDGENASDDPDVQDVD